MSPRLPKVDTAVVLAAGNGRRLHDMPGDPPSKPLTRVGGMPLIVRTLAQLKRAGVEKAVVVIGYRADELKAALRGDRRLEGLQIVFADNADWKKSNGVSVLAAAPHIDGEFLLLMSDHVFDKQLLPGILDEAARPDAGGAVLAVDSKIDDIFDLPDCTLVKTDGRGRILDIGIIRQFANRPARLDVGDYHQHVWQNGAGLRLSRSRSNFSCISVFRVAAAGHRDRRDHD